jgi:hypothetical protein
MEGLEKKEKPAVLYIAAQTAGIKELVPIKGRHRDKDEGPVIFSTPDKALASIFLVEGHNDSWMHLGYFSGIPYVVICIDRDEFVKKDKGGVIYEVPSDTFDYNPNLGMKEKEWTSKEPVKPLKETSYPSALDTMIDNGVNVYFVDKNTFDEINNSNDYGLSILLSLESENNRVNKVIRPFLDQAQ